MQHIYSDGCWKVECEENIIKYKTKNYNIMNYDNKKKELMLVNTANNITVTFNIQIN